MSVYPINGRGAIRISLNSQTHITDSTFSNNTSTGTTSFGGAIFLFASFGPTNGSAQIDILRSTFQNNTANSAGGAIELRGASISNITASIRHSTIVSNQADLDQSDASEYSGGGIDITNNTNLTLANTIVAGNTDHVTGPLAVYDDIAMDKGFPAPSSSISSEGTNFIGANNTLIVGAFPTGNLNVNFDYIGTVASKLIPDLQALADNGGPTMTLLRLSMETWSIKVVAWPNPTTSVVSEIPALS